MSEIGRLQSTLDACFFTEVSRELDCAISANWATSRVGLPKVASLGGRVRAYLVRCGGGPLIAEHRASLVKTASAIELMHLSTLVHDDVIDESQTRRGDPATWTGYGIGRAITAGDALMGLAFGLASESSPEVVALMAAALQDVCDGQMMEFDDLGREQRTRADIETIAERKTGTLFALSLQCGSVCAGHEASKQIRDLGTRLGLAYQLLDDLDDIDYVRLGDAAGGDARSGLLTEPWLQIGELGDTGVAQRELIRGLWQTDGPSTARQRISALLASVKSNLSGVLASAEASAVLQLCEALERRAEGIVKANVTWATSPRRDAP